MSEPSGGWASPSGWAPPPEQAPLLDTGSYGAAPPPAGWQAPAGWGGPQANQYGGWGPRPPEVRPGVVPLRPLGLGELLDGAVSVIRRYPRPCLGLSAAIAVLSTLVNVAIALTALQPLLDFDSDALARGDTEQLEGALGGAALGGFGGAAVSALATLLLTGVLTVIAGRAVLGQPMTLGEAWAQVRPALWRLLGITLLTALIVYGTFAASIGIGVALVAAGGASAALIAVPIGLAGTALAVYLYVRLALAPAVTVLERVGVRRSLSRSGLLVRRSWWRICGILLLTVLIGGFVSNVVQLPFVLFGGGGGGLSGLTDPSGTTTTGLILTYVGAGIAQTVVAPFTAGVRALLYIDRRMRAEGLDVALTAAVAQPPAA